MAVNAPKWPAQQFYFACVYLSTEDIFCTPAPVSADKKSAHIAVSLHASPNFKNFTPRGQHWLNAIKPVFIGNDD